MDQDPNSLTPYRPPRLAEGLIVVLSPKNTRDAVLGDLAEEFETRCTISHRSAWFWYCGQVVRSSPHLLYARIPKNRIESAFFGLLTILLGTIFMQAWDVIISRNSARIISTWESPPALTVIRAIYFAVLSIGAAFCGMAIARIAFSRQRTFWRNATLYLAPVFLVLASFAMISVAERGFVQSSAYLLIRFGLMSSAMLITAALAFQRMQNR